MAEPADKKPPKRQRKKRKAKGKPRGIHVVRKNDKQPFHYDAKPIIAAHTKPGRPTDYHALRGAELIAHMAGGLCVTAAAAAMGFDPTTIYEWAKVHQEFSLALKRGKACWTLYNNRKLNQSVDGPAVTAAIFSLKNACPDEWRDKLAVESKTAPDDPLLAYLRSIDGKVMRPVEPPTIEAEYADVTDQPAPPQIEGPPRPIHGGA